MPDAWPGTLPQRFQQGTFRRTTGDGRLKSQTDTGPGKQRRRSSAMPDTITGAMICTTAQLVILREFIDVTLLGGSLPFTFPDPEEGADPLLLRIGSKMPDVSDKAVNWWNVAFTFEVLP